MNYEANNNSLSAVAIIAMNGRFPDAPGINQFWENLKNGVESVKFFNREQLIELGIDEHLLDNPKFVAADAILEGMEFFDASFFDYSAREAEIMDPQHRLFLEAAWEVMESAGYSSEVYEGRIGVFAGSALSGYMVRNLYSNPGLVENVGTFKIMIANSQDFLTTRVSYKMNLTGPSINVNTLCSSSMVAVHLACQNLLNYSCDLALAGGVSFQISRNEAFFYQEGGIGSFDGHCRAFDANANGTVSGSGLAMVVLKRLEDALADGDEIQAVIIGSAINNDGSAKNSFTAPNVDGQAECIAEAIAMAGVNPETISYVETHGTGTNLGDPIEVAALTKVFRSYTDKKGFSAIGSVKTNIGHLVTAGGVASMIKTILALKNRQIPASLNFESPNPKIDFANSPFFVNTKLTDWQTNGFPRRAGVSSFGIGGTNAHVILEEAPPIKPSGDSKLWQLICLSAKTETALNKMTTNLCRYAEQFPERKLADIAFTLHVGRNGFGHRRFLVCRDTTDLVKKLTALSEKTVFSSHQKSKGLRVVFMFPGESSQEMEFNVGLYQYEPVFRESINDCIALVRSLHELDLQPFLFSGKSLNSLENLPVSNQKTISSLIAFTIEYALAQLWLSWEIVPQCLLGKNVGEYVAACIAGVFSLEDALRLVGATDDALLEMVRQINYNLPQQPFISNLSGTWITNDEATDSLYWLQRGRQQSSKFSEGLQEAMQDLDRFFVELGPGQEIVAEMQSAESGLQQVAAVSVGAEQISLKTSLEAVGQFWLAGGKVNWNKFYQHEKRHRVALPTYPFERERYWIEPGKRLTTGSNEPVATPQLTKRPRPELATEYLAARNPVEEVIAKRWQEVLGFDKIGVNDDFFELGGHSLLAAAIATDLSKEFQIEIPLRKLFETTTIAEIAELIETYRWTAAAKENATNESGTDDQGVL